MGDLKAHPQNDTLPPTRPHYSNKAISPNSATPYGPTFKHMSLMGPCLFKPPHQLMRWCCSHSNFPPQLNPCRKSLRHSQKYASCLILDPVQLAISINYYKDPPRIFSSSRSLPKSHLHYFQPLLAFLLNTVQYLLSCYTICAIIF